MAVVVSSGVVAVGCGAVATVSTISSATQELFVFRSRSQSFAQVPCQIRVALTTHLSRQTTWRNATDGVTGEELQTAPPAPELVAC
jgi:hypothetical protein